MGWKKAHPDVFKRTAPGVDDDPVTTGQGRHGGFHQHGVILTSKHRHVASDLESGRDPPAMADGEASERGLRRSLTPGVLTA